MSEARAATRGDFRRLLLARYRELWTDIQRELRRDEDQSYAQISGEVHDLEDEATADLLVDINLADIHRDIGEMRDIEAALRRIDDRSYGTCCDCGDEIPVERLRAYPTAKRCLSCQARHERTHATMRGTTL